MTTATTTLSRQLQLVARPDGEPTADHFTLVETEIGPPAPGEVLVRNTYLSVDPYMRGRMDDAEDYVAPFALHAPLEGAAVGEVVASRDDRFAPGDVVGHWLSWRELAVAPAEAFERIDAEP